MLIVCRVLRAGSVPDFRPGDSGHMVQFYCSGWCGWSTDRYEATPVEPSEAVALVMRYQASFHVWVEEV